jgi:acyl dehydratase
MDTIDFQSLEPGQALPELVIDITPKLIVGSAIATRDYQDVHHDQARARELGSKDIFMNILASNGLVGRYVTDWSGPESILKSVKIRLGAPNYPGDRMTMSGAVARKWEENGEKLVEVELVGANSLGNHVTGRVVVACG